MTLNELFVELRRRDVLLFTDGGDLIVRAKPGQLTQDLVTALRERKGDVLTALTSGGDPWAGDGSLCPVAPRDDCDEIEAVLRRHPLVGDAVVQPNPDGPGLIGYVVRKPVGAEPPAAERQAPWGARLPVPVPASDDAASGGAGSEEAVADHARTRHLASALQEAALEEESTAAMVATLADLGLFRTPDEVWTAGEIAGRFGLPGPAPVLLGRWLRFLAADGRLVRVGEEQYRAVTPLVHEMPRASGRRPGAEDGATAAYVRACHLQLGALLRGQVNPLALLAPDGDWGMIEAIHGDNPALHAVNARAARLVASLVEGAPGPVRVLEIGGGVGSVTRALLPALPPDRTRYLFTDRNPLALDRASIWLAPYPFVNCAVFDGLHAPLAQGLVPGEHDLIIAANHLHNAVDPAAALAGLKLLLAPGGVLLIVTDTVNSRAHAVSLGFTDGTGRTEGTGPFLSCRQWTDALTAAGFAPAQPDEESTGSAAGTRHALIVARAPAPTRAERQAAFDTACRALRAEPLRAGLSRLLPGAMLPDWLVVLDRFPLTATGTVDRAALPMPVGAMAPRQTGRSEPTSLEERILDAWRRLLNRSDIGLHDNFFELGGDSLLMATLQQQLATDLHRPIAVVDLFASPTIAAMAAYLRGTADGPSATGLEERVALRRAVRSRRGRSLAGDPE